MTTHWMTTMGMALLAGTMATPSANAEPPAGLLAPVAVEELPARRVAYVEQVGDFQNNPGTFYRSPGWIERDSDPDANPASVTSRMGITHDYAKLVEEYGEDNAEYLMETMGNWLKHYRQLTLIETGVGPAEEYRKISRAQAQENEWKYEEVPGDTILIDKLLNGDWNDDDFLVVKPGEQVDVSNEEGIIRSIARPA